MKVLEERLTYLFVVFCKDLLCLPNSILAQGLSFVRSHFSFPSLPLLVLKVHMQFNSFDSQAAHILDLWVICLSALAILFDRSFFHSTLGWDSLVFNMVVTFLSLLHAMQLSFLHNGALHVTNWPEWVVGAIWSNGLIKVWSNQAWFNSETNHPADEKWECFWNRKRDKVSWEIRMRFYFLAFVSFGVCVI